MLDGYYFKETGTLSILAENIPEFQRLLKKAKEEARQLNETIEQLSDFEFRIRFDVETE